MCEETATPPEIIGGVVVSGSSELR